MGHRVPKPLRVDDQLCARWQRDAYLGCWIGAVVAQYDEAVRIVSEVEEPAHDPARPFRVQPIVVVLVQVEQASTIGVGLQLDDAATADIRSRFARAACEVRRFSSLRVDPNAILVCARRRVVPEPIALDLAESAGQRREARLAR